MKIGIPKEVKDKENRVACTPGGARMFVQQGHQLLIETHAGEGSGFPDAAYTAVGARILPRAQDIFAEADMIIKVKEPQPSEFNLDRKSVV